MIGGSQNRNDDNSQMSTADEQLRNFTTVRRTIQYGVAPTTSIVDNVHSSHDIVWHHCSLSSGLVQYGRPVRLFTINDDWPRWPTSLNSVEFLTNRQLYLTAINTANRLSALYTAICLHSTTSDDERGRAVRVLGYILN